MALLSFHSARRGFLGFLTYITGTDGVSRGGVIPAFTLTSSAGVEVTGFGGGDATAANQVLSNTKLDQLHTDMIAATPAGTNAIGTVTAVGNVANAVADSGNPVKVGGVYSNATSLSALTAGNRGDLQADSFGNARVTLAGNAGAPVATATTVILPFSRASNQTTLTAPLGALGFLWNGTNVIPQPGDTNGAVAQPYALAAARWSYAAAAGGISNTTTAVTISSAGGAGNRNYLASIEIDNDTLGAATEIAVRDGAGGTVLWRGKLQTAAGSRSYTFATPLKGTANTLMEVVTLTAVTGGVFFNAQGFTAT